MTVTSEGMCKPSVSEQIAGLNRQLDFALTFAESVVRQGNRRAAIEVLEEQRSAMRRTSASITKTLLAPLHRRRRIRVIGAVALTGLLLGSAAYGTTAIVRRSPEAVPRSSFTADINAANAAAITAGSPTGGRVARATRGTFAAVDSPQDAAALARDTQDLIGEALSVVLQMSRLSSSIEATKRAVEAGEAQAPQPPAQLPKP